MATITADFLVGIEKTGAFIPTFEKRYPIAEHFLSPQGEGHFVGTLMQFIRFAGCTVGKPFTKAEREDIDPNGKLNVYQEKCTAWNGTAFACDTNYRMSQKMSVSEIMALIPDNVQHVCLTGGEPLMHDLKPLLVALRQAKKFIHVETSGTISLQSLYTISSVVDIWVAVSPKAGYLREAIDDADELKILIGDDFDEDMFVSAFHRYFSHGKVYIQPINDEFTLDMRNVQKCIDLQLRYPALMLSVQTHKILKVR